jgi:hypothetical protein
VTQTYFDFYTKGEPKTEGTITECIAYHWRKAAGIRLLTARGIRNDPMALVYFNLRSRNVHGTTAAIEDRAVIEWKKGKLTKVEARRLIDEVTEPPLPEHKKEFGKLMGIKELEDEE